MLANGLEQLLGVSVTIRRHFPTVTSSNDFLFSGRPTGLSTDLPSYNNSEPFDIKRFQFKTKWQSAKPVIKA